MIKMLKETFEEVLSACNYELSGKSNERPCWNNNTFSFECEQETGVVAVTTGHDMQWAGEMFIDTFAKTVKSKSPYIIIWAHWKTVDTSHFHYPARTVTNCLGETEVVHDRPVKREGFDRVELKRVYFIDRMRPVELDIGNDLEGSINSIRQTKPLAPESFRSGVIAILRDIRDIDDKYPVLDQFIDKMEILCV